MGGYLLNLTWRAHRWTHLGFYLALVPLLALDLLLKHTPWILLHKWIPLTLVLMLVTNAAWYVLALHHILTLFRGALLERRTLWRLLCCMSRRRTRIGTC